MSIREASLSLLVLAAAALPAAAQAVAPVAGDLAISEIMNNPGIDACVTDNNGEWFEITNISTKVLDLNGIFIGDGVTPTAAFFRTMPVVATIPDVYPGQAIVFARRASALVNGGVSNVVYEYAAVGTAPADNSQIGSTAMNLNNGADGIHISVGGPLTLPSPNPNGYVLGTEIEAVTYDSSQAPYTSGGNATAAERKDLFAPMTFTAGAPNVNSANLAISTNGFHTFLAGSCGPGTPTSDFTQFGTPGAVNSTDTTPIWPSNSIYDSVSFPNTGVLSPDGPATIGGGAMRLSVASGPALTPFFLGYAGDVVSETPISLFIPGNPGSFVIDLGTAQYTPLGAFNATGDGAFNVPLPPVPALIGVDIRLQWLAIDPSFVIVLSNGAIVELLN